MKAVYRLGGEGNMALWVTANLTGRWRLVTGVMEDDEQIMEVEIQEGRNMYTWRREQDIKMQVRSKPAVYDCGIGGRDEQASSC